MSHMRDWTYAARALKRAPGYLLAGVGNLGIATALCTTIIATMDAVLRPRVPLRQQDNLFQFEYLGVAASRLGWTELQRTLDIRAPAIVASATLDVPKRVDEIEYEGNKVPVLGLAAVGQNFFDVLGARAAYGRLLTSGDFGAAQRCVISYELWQRLQSGNRTFSPFLISWSETTYTVVGVLPRRAVDGFRRDLWIVDRRPALDQGRVVRVRPGTTELVLAAELRQIHLLLSARAGTDPRRGEFALRPVVRPPPYVWGMHAALSGAAVAVLLIACVNTILVQSARSLRRHRDLAVRVALGASPRDVLRTLASESTLVAVVGGLTGLVLSIWAVQALRGQVPEIVASVGLFEPQLSWRVIVGSVGLIAILAFVVGLLPSARLTNVDCGVLLKGPVASGTPVRTRFDLLIAAEVACALALTAGSICLIATARQLHVVDNGYDRRGVLHAWVVPPAETGKPVTAGIAQLEEVFARLLREPGVLAAAERAGDFAGQAIVVETAGEGNVEIPVPFIGYRLVTPSYLRTLRIPIIRGSDFDLEERGGPVAVIDSVAARRWWPAENPVGRLLRLGGQQTDAQWVRVVGVARHVDVPSENSDTRAAAQVYVDSPRQFAEASSSIQLVVKAGAAEGRIVAEARMTGPLLRFLRGLQPWDEWNGVTALRRTHDFVASVFLFLAAAGLILAGLGAYGVVNQAVAHRRREFGVRLALGSSRFGIVFLIISEQWRAGAAGVAMGSLLSLWGLATVNTVVVGMSGRLVAVSVMAACVVVVLASAVAGLRPAAAAALLDPCEVLRAE